MIDLRSDTVTQPGTAMRQAMAAATVGDDVYGEDPTVTALEQRVSVMAGMEAGLFVSSGTQSNLLALLVHCQRGDEYLVGQDYHCYLHEAGGAAVLGGIQPQPMVVEEDGSLDLARAEALIKPDDDHFARTRLLALENTHHGKVIGLDYLHKARELVDRHGLALHLDGARVFNAATVLGVELKQITRFFDSVSICFSKGLGTPVGSVLCGSAEFIRTARRWRKMLGGGMRQAGVLAVAADYALDHQLADLACDHKHALLLQQRLVAIEGIEIGQQLEPVQSNMLYLQLPSLAAAEQLAEQMALRGITIGASATLRLVIHRDLSAEMIEQLAQAFEALLPPLFSR